MSSLKSLGKIVIPEEQILYYDLVFNNNAILIITVEKNIYLINVKTWEPLTVLYTEIILKNNNILPKNQLCKSLKCKIISDEKGYATFSFANGNYYNILYRKNKRQSN